jgi:hypothetical protein
MRTIREHEVASSEESGSSTDLREHKVYKMHLEPAFFTDRPAGLHRLKTFLLSLPLGEQSTWTFEEAPTVEESSDLDTEDGAVAKTTGISLKMERNSQERSKRLVLKVKGLDPLVVGRHQFACAGKKFVLRQDLVFSYDKSVVSRAWKCKIKVCLKPMFQSSLISCFAVQSRAVFFSRNLRIVSGLAGSRGCASRLKIIFSIRNTLFNSFN